MKLCEPGEQKRRMLKQAKPGQENTSESISFHNSQSPQIHLLAIIYPSISIISFLQFLSQTLQLQIWEILAQKTYVTGSYLCYGAYLRVFHGFLKNPEVFMLRSNFAFMLYSTLYTLKLMDFLNLLILSIQYMYTGIRKLHVHNSQIGSVRRFKNKDTNRLKYFYPSALFKVI